MADIETARRPDKADKVDIDAAKNLPKWVIQLSAVICAAFDCQIIHDPNNGKLIFIGVGADAQVAAYTFNYLERTIRKLCNAYLKQHNGPGSKGRFRSMHRQSYCLGSVSIIQQRLAEQKLATPVTTGALIPLKETLIRQTIGDIGNVRTIQSRTTYVHADAFRKGQDDGRNIGLHQGIEKAKSSHKELY